MEPESAIGAQGLSPQSVAVLEPSSPVSLLPQASSLPFAIARLRVQEAEIAVTLESAGTFTANRLLTVEPMPSWPCPLKPVASTVPSLSSAKAFGRVSGVPHWHLTLGTLHGHIDPGCRGSHKLLRACPGHAQRRG